MKFKNTLRRGLVRFLIFREGDTWYGVGLEFNIVESGSTPQEALFLLSEAVHGYLESARKVKARPHILNQKSDAEYEELRKSSQEPKTLPKKLDLVYISGYLNIGKISSRALVPA